jgi:hypothetical protein
VDRLDAGHSGADHGRARSDVKPGDAKPEPPPPPPLNSLERYLERRTLFALGRNEPGKDEGAYKATLHALVARQGAPPSGTAGWCCAFVQEKRRTIAFIGQCAPRDLEEQTKIWRYIAEHVQFSEPEARDVTKLRLKYQRSGLRGSEYRVEVASRLVRGWKAEDTENFIVVYHTPDQALVRTIASDLESIRKKYVELFPPVDEVLAVSTVRVCRDRNEYLAYGGSPWSAGYWNSETCELVFYDATIKEKGKRETGEENTFIVLYHEAFHQFIHYSAGELPPHSWFNEGHGDFFSGANIKGTRVTSIGVNSWRIGTIQSAIAEHHSIPWKDIIEFEQPDYYRMDRIRTCYAQGWSMIYFLRTAKVALEHPRWSKILAQYFDTLKADYGRRLAELDLTGKGDDERAREEAGVEARKAAVKCAFEGVNLSEIEAAWKDYTLKLELKR